MLELSGVSKSFGGVKAVQEVSMRLETGRVQGLIGPNGAGKSTLVNLISGLLTQTAGSLSLDGKDLAGSGPTERAALGIARTFQNLRVFPTLTVGQNIEVAGYTASDAGRGSGALVAEVVEQFGLSDQLNARADTLVYGQLRRLEIVRALALSPSVLMLDEPAAGMNEQETEVLGRSLDWVRGRIDCALLVIDHDLKFIMSLCDRITVMNMGAKIAEGTPKEVSEDRHVIDAYLGKEEDAA